MPIYTYHCENCGHEFDKRQSFSEAPLVVCPNCRKHQLRKVYSPAGVVFKGSGFYVTDKRNASSTSLAGKANGSDKDSKKKSEGAGDAAKGEKTETVKSEKTTAKKEKSGKQAN